jgi:hypothetical protein
MKKPIVSFDRVYQKTSKALGVSYTSVHHIMNGKNLWEKCLSGSSKVHMAERKILQVRYLTYGWLFYKVHLLPPEKWQQNRSTIVSFDRVYQKTSKALGVSYTSVHHIMNGKRPCKSNRPKERAKILDDFHHYDIIPCFPKRFDLSQIITPIIDNIHLIVQNSSIITYFFISISKIDACSEKS